MAPKRPFSERVWFFSPAIATALFFTVQIALSFSSPRQIGGVEGAAADTPNPTNVKVRVVEQIRPLDRKVHTASRVPATEAELMELFGRDGAVVFFQDEVEVVETSEREFEAEVITLRKGRALRSSAGDSGASSVERY
jgi:hypothetical protein